MKSNLQTISEVNLIYRTKVKASERPQIKSSKDAFDIFMESWDLDSIEYIEEFNLMLLNRSNRVLGISSLSKDCTTGTAVDIKLLL
jgi:DNA repair protein RadC